MRWYVSRNGETVGPVEEAQVAEWVRGGMHDAVVRDDAGGHWTPIAHSPFGAGLVPAQPTPIVVQQVGLGSPCRVCGAYGTKQVRSDISAGGWIFFIVMFLLCFPIALIGLFQRNTYAVCAQCGAKAWG